MIFFDAGDHGVAVYDVKVKARGIRINDKRDLTRKGLHQTGILRIGRKLDVVEGNCGACNQVGVVPCDGAGDLNVFSHIIGGAGDKLRGFDKLPFRILHVMRGLQKLGQRLDGNLFIIGEIVVDVCLDLNTGHFIIRNKRDVGKRRAGNNALHGRQHAETNCLGTACRLYADAEVNELALIRGVAGRKDRLIVRAVVFGTNVFGIAGGAGIDRGIHPTERTAQISKGVSRPHAEGLICGQRNCGKLRAEGNVADLAELNLTRDKLHRLFDNGDDDIRRLIGNVLRNRFGQDQIDRTVVRIDLVFRRGEIAVVDGEIGRCPFDGKILIGNEPLLVAVHDIRFFPTDVDALKRVAEQNGIRRKPLKDDLRPAHRNVYENVILYVKLGILLAGLRLGVIDHAAGIGADALGNGVLIRPLERAVQGVLRRTARKGAGGKLLTKADRRSNKRHAVVNDDVARHRDDVKGVFNNAKIHRVGGDKQICIFRLRFVDRQTGGRIIVINDVAVCVKMTPTIAAGDLLRGGRDADDVTVARHRRGGLCAGQLDGTQGHAASDRAARNAVSGFVEVLFHLIRTIKHRRCRGDGDGTL